MEILDLKDKLIKQFQILIKDESKLNTLDGVFDSITVVSNTDSLVSEKQYTIVEERRQKRILGKTKGKSWNDVKNELKQKYEF